MKRHSFTERILVYAGAATLLGALFLAALAYANYQQAALKKTQDASAAASATDQTRAVQICQVFAQPMTDILRLPATVEASEDIDLAARVAGRIEWIGADEGDRVRRGQVLMRLDTEILAADVDRARSAYELAEARFQRIRKVYEAGIEPPETFDETRATLKTSSATLTQALVNLQYASIQSPIDGILDRSLVDSGEYVNVGQSVARLVNIDAVEVVCAIPERDVHYFEPGQAAKVFLTTDGEREFTGTISFVARTAESASRTYPLKIVVANPDHRLRPGMIVRAELVRQRLDDAIGIPFFAMLEREKSKSVFVVEDGRAVEREVRMGFFQGGMVQIVSGLKAGDALVVVGQRELVNGEPVRVAADLTALARQYAASGKDLSQLALELR